MRVLDCGCGPGSITLGLAEVVAPGEVVGINIEVPQIELARAETAKRNITNVRFDVADAHNLGFSDATFDAVVGHTILMQFRDPSPVLKELSRVLKPGGLAGFREPAFDGNLCEPPNGARRQYSTLFNRMLDHNGNDPRVGRRLGGLMHHMGFGRVTTSSSYEVAGTADAKQAHRATL
jgi:ubiquinone/menaquinone biosynthesis C-methylase UbiE